MVKFKFVVMPTNCGKNAAKKIISFGFDIPTKKHCLNPSVSDEFVLNASGYSSITSRIICTSKYKIYKHPKVLTKAKTVPQCVKNLSISKLKDLLKAKKKN